MRGNDGRKHKADDGTDHYTRAAFRRDPSTPHGNAHGTHSSDGTAHERKGKEWKPAECRANHRAGNRAGRTEQPGGKEEEQEGL